ncbi:hypothetical protein [Gabonibacter chumensis]|uniref:hypothetical protein n=1 Tax=Gabonibacter chumensis TaxID=2972474 RepID=UPI00257373CF|nr:hypothetical protein [Gabonibacter chumensis]MCR9012376.1 hypothetical protein [Gabonibacter chumensis]
MSDNALDIIVYIALTIGASVLGALKSSKDKNKKRQPSARHETARPEIFVPAEDETEGDFFDQIFGKRVEVPQQEVEIEKPEVGTEKQIIPDFLKRKEAEAIAHFGKSEEERMEILKSDQRARKDMRDKRFAALFQLHENDMQESDTNESISGNTIRFDLPEAVIASEILNRKY